VTDVRVSRGVLDMMVEHARRDAPLECCGLLLGSAASIDEAIVARNTRASATRYEIHPEDHFNAIRLARRSGRTVRGAYHSHPRGPAHPSETDLAEAHDDSLLYIIVSLAAAEPVIQAFRLEHRNFTRVELVPHP
jgi:proteasome lid subunit RPN8/RPN11